MYFTFQLTQYLTFTIALGFNFPVLQQTAETQSPQRAPTLEQPSSELTPAPTSAETVSPDSFAVVFSESGEKANSPDNALSNIKPALIDQELNSKKLLNEETPEWVKQGVVLEDEHRFAICSSLLPDIDQCKDDLNARLMGEVQAYLDGHVLSELSAHQLVPLTKEYVEKYWMIPSQKFDNVQDRPSGTYHQLWVGLHISAEQLQKVREWEVEALRQRRVKQVGVVGGVGVAAITLLSGLVGVLARREKAKLKT